MTEPWVLVAGMPLAAGEHLPLPEEEAHHLRRVLRRRSGDEVVVCDGAGRVAHGILVAGKQGGAAVELRGVREVPPQDPAGVPAVALGVLHGPAMDWAVQKAVELGVPRFVPLLCQRSQLGRAAAGRRVEHWRRVARQALKQCHRPWLMELMEPHPLPELLEGLVPGRGIVADRGGIRAASLEWEGPRILLVGPEGGLTREEVLAAERAGWVGVRLGEYVLRAETAVVVGAAVLGRFG